MARRLRAKTKGGASVRGQAVPQHRGGQKGKSLYNHHVFVVRALFELAVEDRLLAKSPATEIIAVKRDKPIRRTPSFEEFLQIVGDIRSQKYSADSEASADFVEFLVWPRDWFSFQQLHAALARWFHDYNHYFPHSSLRHLTPAQYESNQQQLNPAASP